MPLSECVYCVAIAFKMTEWVEQRLCTKFCIKLEHSSAETIQMIQKAAGTGDWWLAASSRQRTCSCTMSHAEFSGETSNHPSDSAPYSPDLVPCHFWLFLKLKSPLKLKRSQTVNEIQKNTSGQLMAIGELCKVPRYLLWRELRCHGPMYNVSCILNFLQ